METGFLNFHDEEHFSICEQSSGFENDSSLFGANEYIDSFTIPWDQKFNVNVSQIKVEPNCNEDYEKTFNAWNQHLKELDNSIKCEGGIFLPGIDDPVCFSTGSPTHEDSVFPHPPFIKSGGEDVIFSQGSDDEQAGGSSPSTEPCAVIQVKSEPDQQKPALEAGDLKTLLEQFEAASKPASTKKTQKKLKCSNTKTSPTIVHKSIKDALPKQVIDRIRESCKRRKEASSAQTIVVRETVSSTSQSPPTILPTNHNTSLLTERVEDSESGKLLRLEHNYCFRDGSTDKIKDFIGDKEEPMPQNTPDYNTSRKDSGMESGELTDNSSVGSPQQMCHSLPPNVVIKQEVDTESVEEANAKKKKKLKLEEYWERRKNMKPVVSSSSTITMDQQVVIKTEPEDVKPIIDSTLIPAPTNTTTTTSTSTEQVTSTSTLEESNYTGTLEESNCTGTPHPPKSLAEKLAPKPNMVSVEVQTADLEKDIKKEKDPIDEELQKKKEMWLETMRSTYRPRYSSSSSSSSYETKSWSRRRGKTASRRYRRRRSDSSYSRSRSRSRSRSTRSRSSSSSSSSSSEYSSGRSRSKSRRRRHSFSRNRTRKYSAGRTRRVREDWSPVEKQRQVEERRVIYVGQIEDGISKQRLRDRFHKFGHIVDISLHFRERGDNYGFVTFKYPEDAYQAVEHGNDYGLEPKYDICFGGRRAFCKQRYSDLDSVSTAPHYTSSFQAPPIRSNCNSFDMLLREAQENLRKRSTV